ncbi:MAG: hypothetical protein JWQ35_562 [Bacteriovoracaceae bacterium]|nr:hypothetical protein [Bacteriovoracaceae bacterium]
MNFENGLSPTIRHSRDGKIKWEVRFNACGRRSKYFRRRFNTKARFKGIKAHETIFQNSRRNPSSHNNFVKRKFYKDVSEWGRKHIRFHDLRHTSTTLMNE